MNMKIWVGALLLSASTSVHADTRTFMYLKGAAVAITAHCKSLKMTRDSADDSGYGNGTGDQEDFIDGQRLIDEVWGKSLYGDGAIINCHTVCSEMRSGTCNFVKR